MKRIVYDAVQLAGLCLVAAGVGLAFNWALAMIAAGALLIGFTLLEALLFRPR